VAAIEELGRAPERRMQMSAINLVHVKSFDWARVAARVRDEYLVAIERRLARSGAPRPLLADAFAARLARPARVPIGELSVGLPELRRALDDAPSP